MRNPITLFANRFVRAVASLNENQIMITICFTILNIGAALQGDADGNRSWTWWSWFIIVGFWPAVVLISAFSQAGDDVK